MTKHHFKITLGDCPSSSSIELNGEPLKGVRRISFDIDANERQASFVTLELYATAECSGVYTERLMTGSAAPAKTQAA